MYSNPTPYPSVTTVLSPYTDFNAVPPPLLAAAADRGSRCHASIADHLMDDFPVIDADVRPYFASFLAWSDRMIESVVLVETRLTDETFGFTGQIDFVGRLHGDSCLTLLDWKTGQQESKTWRIQIAAYRHLATLAGLDIGRGMSVRLRRDGSAAIATEYPRMCAGDFGIFIGLLNAYKFFREGK
jgi:hypothetical protein